MALDSDEDFKKQEVLSEEIVWAVSGEAYEKLRWQKDNSQGKPNYLSKPVRHGPAEDPRLKKGKDSG